MKDDDQAKELYERTRQNLAELLNTRGITTLEQLAPYRESEPATYNKIIQLFGQVTACQRLLQMDEAEKRESIKKSGIPIGLLMAAS